MSRNQTRAREEEAVVSLVQTYRRHHPRMGTRKLLNEIQVQLGAQDVRIGRDRLFCLLRRRRLLVQRRRRHRRTTWSGTWRCQNLLKEAKVTCANQAWVSDITYIETADGFAYLALVSDLFSRRIMGFDVSQSLSVEGSMRALSQAIRQAQGKVTNLIHHSDRGIQYTCHAYRQRLERFQIRSSMGETGNCYDNAVAERINGILKLEYGLGDRFASLAQARAATKQAVALYNLERPHLALNFAKPDEVYTQSINGALN